MSEIASAVVAAELALPDEILVVGLLKPWLTVKGVLVALLLLLVVAHCWGGRHGWHGWQRDVATSKFTPNRVRPNTGS
jgi:uncharacterized membrane protein